jgi:cytochrome P450
MYQIGDGSTLSAMLFAIDKSNGRKLCQQVIDNPLLLILAGSETANTLTTSILLLGLPQEAFQNLNEEQRSRMSIP